MPQPNKVSAFTSSPVPQLIEDVEGERTEESHLVRQSSTTSIKRTSDNILGNLYRPKKRISSYNSLNDISDPFFKNIKYYTSKRKMRSTTGPTTTPPGSPPKLNTTSMGSRVSSQDCYSMPSTPLKMPGLSFEDTPVSQYSPSTPNGRFFSGSFPDSEYEDYEDGYTSNDHVARRLFRTDTDEDLKIGELSLDSEQITPKKEEHHIFKIPEIVNKILEIYDLQNSYVPHEQPPVRRIPLSYEHALLIHKDEKIATHVWNESREMIKNGTSSKGKHSLFNCLTVNKLWHQVAVQLLVQNCYFDNESKWLQYASTMNKKLKEERLISPSPKIFVLHKLTYMQQRHFDLVTNLTNFDKLNWLEMYICPKVLPNPKMFQYSNLQKLVITGSKVFNDEFLISVSKHLSNLEVLDLRACELITDSSIYTVSMNCPNLKLLNVGRHTRGELVSDASICSIIRNTNISTLGVAGCGITDRTIWELAINRTHALERLSLNKCWKLTNESVPKTIKFFTKLSVLELRHCTKINNVRPMVEYKRSQASKKINVLIEGCEQIEDLIAQEEIALDIEISKNILEDITDWCNTVSDEE